jgi:hypothetical protein
LVSLVPRPAPRAERGATSGLAGSTSPVPTAGCRPLTLVRFIAIRRSSISRSNQEVFNPGSWSDSSRHAFWSPWELTISSGDVATRGPFLGQSDHGP